MTGAARGPGLQILPMSLHETILALFLLSLPHLQGRIEAGEIQASVVSNRQDREQGGNASPHDLESLSKKERKNQKSGSKEKLGSHKIPYRRARVAPYAAVFEFHPRGEHWFPQNSTFPPLKVRVTGNSRRGRISPSFARSLEDKKGSERKHLPHHLSDWSPAPWCHHTISLHRASFPTKKRRKTRLVRLVYPFGAPHEGLIKDRWDGWSTLRSLIMDIKDKNETPNPLGNSQGDISTRNEPLRNIFWK